MTIGNKYWILIGSNGTWRLQLGKLDTIAYDGKSHVNRFIITHEGGENKHFNEKMRYFYEGEDVCTYSNEYIFEYDDLDKAYLKFLKMYGININNIGVFLDKQMEEYPERFL